MRGLRETFITLFVEWNFVNYCVDEWLPALHSRHNFIVQLLTPDIVFSRLACVL